jgi:tetratricopeptide (TPR) repeat protein
MSKISRKKLKEPDEFLTISEQAVEWCQNNSRIVIFVVAAAVVAIGAVVGLNTYLDHRADQAATAMDRAFDHYASVIEGGAQGKAKPNGAIKSLERVAAQYGATPAGLQARLALGSLLLERGEYQRARPIFDKLSQEPDLPLELQPLIWGGLGAALEGAKKYNEAAEAYAAAERASGDALAVRFRLDQARVLQAAGDLKKAESLYRRVLADGPDDRSEVRIARASLVDMGLDPR